MIRTLIVDDQSMIRVGIRAILDAQDDIDRRRRGRERAAGRRAVPRVCAPTSC